MNKNIVVGVGVAGLAVAGAIHGVGNLAQAQDAERAEDDKWLASGRAATTAMVRCGEAYADMAKDQEVNLGPGGALVAQDGTWDEATLEYWGTSIHEAYGVCAVALGEVSIPDQGRQRTWDTWQASVQAVADAGQAVAREPGDDDLSVKLDDAMLAEGAAGADVFDMMGEIADGILTPTDGSGS